MTEVEKCRRELARAEQDARANGLTSNQRDNRRQLVDRARRKLDVALDAEQRNLARTGR